jgi:hypothetical protein
MRLRSRKTPEVFGTSLLDMMTCSLGAVILLFVLKSAVETGLTEKWRKRLEHQQALHQSATNQQAKADIIISNATKRIQRAAEGSVFGLPPVTGRVVPWIRSWKTNGTEAENRFSALGSSLHNALRSSFGYQEVRDGLGEATTTSNMLQRSAELLGRQPRGGTSLMIMDLPYHRVTDPVGDIERLLNAIDRNRPLEERSRSLRFHTVGFVTEESLRNDSFRRTCEVAQYLSGRYGGVFIAIPTP